MSNLLTLNEQHIPASLLIAHQWESLCLGSCATITEFVQYHYELYKINFAGDVHKTHQTPLGLGDWLQSFCPSI